MSLISRSEWGAASPRKTVPLTKPKGVAVHWVGVEVHGDPRNITQSIQRYHQKTKGWWDVAYNELIGDGVRLEGRGWRNRSGANGTGRTNRSHAAICVLLGPNQEVKDGHIDAVRTSIAAMRRVHPNATEIVGHRDLKKSTSCPGDDLAQLVRSGAFEPGEPAPGQIPNPHPSSGYPIPTRTLRRGDRGDEVAWLQYQLNQQGAQLQVDGILGKKSVKAVVAYQLASGLVPDGLAGVKTISSLIGRSL
jgi:hypothetical protein